MNVSESLTEWDLAAFLPDTEAQRGEVRSPARGRSVVRVKTSPSRPPLRILDSLLPPSLASLLCIYLFF